MLFPVFVDPFLLAIVPAWCIFDLILLNCITYFLFKKLNSTFTLICIIIIWAYRFWCTTWVECSGICVIFNWFCAFTGLGLGLCLCVAVLLLVCSCVVWVLVSVAAHSYVELISLTVLILLIVIYFFLRRVHWHVGRLSPHLFNCSICHGQFLSMHSSDCHSFWFVHSCASSDMLVSIKFVWFTY